MPNSNEGTGKFRPLRLFSFSRFRRETDFFGGRDRRLHYFTDRGEERPKLLGVVVKTATLASDLALERGQRRGQILVGLRDLAKAIEGSHDADAGGNGDRRPEDGREHDGAVLGEGKGREFWIAMLLGTGRKLRPVQGVHFYSGKPERFVVTP